MSASARLAALGVVMVAAVPGLTTLGSYFLADDFGLIQLFSQKPPLHFLTLFNAPWWEEIYGFRGDELRPFLALSYQVNWWLSGTQPWAYHLSNTVFHALNALLVYGLAREMARLDLLPATFAGALFGLMGVHAEVVAWISGRADSVPALFFLAAILAYVRWRRRGGMGFYLLSLLAFFAALYSKQSAITLLPALVLYDALCGSGVRSGSPLERIKALPVRAYLPFAAMTGAYLALRLALFGNAVREQQINVETLRVFWERQGTYLQMMTGGMETLDAAGWALAGLTALLVACAVRVRERWGEALFAGPVWWLVTVGPLAVTYLSARHLYLASAGVAVLTGIGLQAACRGARAGPPGTGARSSMPGRATRPVALLAFVVLLGQGAVLGWGVGEWNAAGRLSGEIAGEIQQQASSLPEGSLLVLGAAPSGDEPRLWVWHWGLSLPFAVQPPFMAPEVERHLFIIARPELYCCGFQRWYDGTRDAVTGWRTRQGNAPAVAVAWELPSGEPVRLSDPQLKELAIGLLQADSAGSMAGGLDAVLRPMGGTGARFRFK